MVRWTCRTVVPPVVSTVEAPSGSDAVSETGWRLAQPVPDVVLSVPDVALTATQARP